MADALDAGQSSITDHPRVAVIHYRARVERLHARAAPADAGDGGAAGQMVEWAGGEQAIQGQGMQRMASPEIVAQANPDVMLMTEFGYDRLGSARPDEDLALPGVATSQRARRRPHLPRRANTS